MGPLVPIAPSTDASHLCGTVHKPLREHLIHRRSVTVGLDDTDRGQRSNDLPGSDADAGCRHPTALAAQATTPFSTEGEIRCWTTSPWLTIGFSAASCRSQSRAG